MKLGEGGRDCERERGGMAAMKGSFLILMFLSRMKESGKRTSLVIYAEASLVGSFVGCGGTDGCELGTYREGHSLSRWIEKA